MLSGTTKEGYLTDSINLAMKKEGQIGGDYKRVIHVILSREQ